MKRWVLLTGLLFFSRAARAGDLVFEASVDRSSLTMEDTLTLQLTLSGGRVSLPRPDLPEIPGFRASFAGQSQNFSYMNGEVSNQIVFTYLLAPQAPGSYTLPAFSLTVGGQNLSTRPLPVTVQAAGSAPPAVPHSRNPGPASAPGRDLFVTTTVDKKSVTVGEAVTLTFRFYSGAPLLSQPRYQPPDTTGFLAEDLPPQRQYVERVDGRSYQVVELQTALFPSASGRLTIGPGALECSVRDFSRDPFGGGFFGDVFGGGRSVVLRSDPIVIQVAPVPTAGRPASFQGDVGRYSLSASLDKTDVQVNEPVTLTVTVSGEGNIKALSAPQLPDLHGFKIYETLSSLNIDKKDRRVAGSKVFTTLLKPEVTGTLALPPLEFSYFDPGRKKFETVKGRSLSVVVRPGAAGSASAFPAEGGAPVLPAEGVKVMGPDIRFIKTAGRLGSRRRPFMGSSLALGLLGVPGFVFLSLWTGWAIHRRSLTDQTGRRSRGARRRAAKAVAALREPHAPAALEKLHRVYWEFLSQKAGIPAQGCTSAQLKSVLETHGVSHATQNKGLSLGESFDRARFAPALVSAEDVRRVQDALLDFIKEVDREWKDVA